MGADEQSNSGNDKVKYIHAGKFALRDYSGRVAWFDSVRNVYLSRCAEILSALITTITTITTSNRKHENNGSNKQSIIQWLRAVNFPVKQKILQLQYVRGFEPVRPSRVKHMLSQVQKGDKIFYMIYPEHDLRSQDTGLFFFRGNKNAKFSICNAGGEEVQVWEQMTV